MARLRNTALAGITGQGDMGEAPEETRGDGMEIRRKRGDTRPGPREWFTGQVWMDEIATAQTHAELAGTATDPNYTYMHMHHTLNCLVGPGGDGFDAKMLNPCAHTGNGAIPDMADPAKKKQLEALAQLSRDAVAAKDWPTAKKDAADVAARLKAFK